jgi:inositol-1,4,5-trisphosphate 5-phosphatase
LFQTQYTRTGLGGFWGNKGGVSVSLTIDGISICFVNSHLAPHLEQLDQRINDYNTIIDDQKFDSRLKHTQILSHEFVFILLISY